MVYRTARCGLRVTRAQRERLFGLLRSAGDVWCAVLELNSWRRSRRDAPLAGYRELCRELAASGPGTFGELGSAGARSVLRRYSDAWFAAAAKRRAGDASARYPRRRRGLVPVRWHAGTFALDGRALRLRAARGRPPLLVRLDRDVPYPAGRVRSVTLGFDAGRPYLDVTAEVPVAAYPPGTGPDPARVAGVDLGIIHPYAAAGPQISGCWSPGGRSAPSAASTCATARAAPGPPPAAPPSQGRAAPAATSATSAASGTPRPGTGGGSGRPSTRQPRPWWAGRWSTGSGRWRSATRAAS